MVLLECTVICSCGVEASLPFFALPLAFFTCLEHLHYAAFMALHSCYSGNSRNLFPCGWAVDLNQKAGLSISPEGSAFCFLS